MDIKPPQKPTQKSGAPPDADLHSLLNKDMPRPVMGSSINKDFEEIEDIDIENIEGKKVSKKKKFTKKNKIIVAVVAVLLLGSAVGGFLFLNQEEEPIVVSQQPAPKPDEPPKYYSPLTGKEFATEAPTKRPVTAVMVENSPEARPQSGLDQADMVYEAIAEAGVTRFMAVYQESTPEKVGPVRSARPYYIDYALGLDATYGHVGGSPEALNDIRTLGVKDLDEFSNARTFWRATDRYAPHNAYTAFDRLDAANQAKGYTNSEFKAFERKIDVPQTPTASSIAFDISGPNYNPTYTYDQDSNSYFRQMAGAPHSDQQTGQQINPKVVVALVTSKGISSDGYHTTYQTVGEGKVYVFQDGIVSEGQWSKPDRQAPLELTDKNGLPMKLNAGKTWLTLVGSADDVRFNNQ